jgi:hypothetical protein
MSKSFKTRDENDSQRLGRIRTLLNEAGKLAMALEGSAQPARTVLRYLIEQAEEKALKLHETAHHGATGGPRAGGAR